MPDACVCLCLCLCLCVSGQVDRFNSVPPLLQRRVFGWLVCRMPGMLASRIRIRIQKNKGKLSAS